MIWEPFALALVLGLVVSAGIYFAYLWPSVEPADVPDPGAEENAEARPVEPAPPAEHAGPNRTTVTGVTS